MNLTGRPATASSDDAVRAWGNATLSRRQSHKAVIDGSISERVVAVLLALPLLTSLIGFTCFSPRAGSTELSECNAAFENLLPPMEFHRTHTIISVILFFVARRRMPS